MYAQWILVEEKKVYMYIFPDAEISTSIIRGKNNDLN